MNPLARPTTPLGRALDRVQAVEGDELGSVMQYLSARRQLSQLFVSERG